MKRIVKIGFVAPQQSGKDYLLSHLLNAKQAIARQYNVESVDVHVIRMADPIKEMCNGVMYSVDPEMLQAYDADQKEVLHNIIKPNFIELVGKELEKINAMAGTAVTIEQANEVFEPYFNEKSAVLTPRQFQQVIGTDLFRKQVDMDFWVKFAERKMAVLAEQSTADIVMFICPDVRFENEASLMDKLVYIHRPNNPHQTVWHESEVFCKAIFDHLNELGAIQQAVKNQYFPIGLQFSPRFDTICGLVTTVCINNG